MLTMDEFEAVIDSVQTLGTRRHARLLYGLVRWLQPMSVVEVGTFTGYTACWLAKALQDNGQGGQLLCIDDWSLEPLAERQLYYNLGVCRLDNVSVGAGKSSEVPWPERVDFAFIDGDHSYDGCEGDIGRAIERGASCIVLHDTSSWWGPRRCVDEFRRKYPHGPKSAWDMIECGFDEGLAVFLKTPEKPAEVFSAERFPQGCIPRMPEPARG